jgi:hypothetical protein
MQIKIRKSQTIASPNQNTDRRDRERLPKKAEPQENVKFRNMVCYHLRVLLLSDTYGIEQKGWY